MSKISDAGQNFGRDGPQPLLESPDFVRKTRRLPNGIRVAFLTSNAPDFLPTQNARPTSAGPLAARAMGDDVSTGRRPSTFVRDSVGDKKILPAQT